MKEVKDGTRNSYRVCTIHRGAVIDLSTGEVVGEGVDLVNINCEQPESWGVLLQDIIPPNSAVGSSYPLEPTTK